MNRYRLFAPFASLLLSFPALGRAPNIDGSWVEDCSTNRFMISIDVETGHFRNLVTGLNSRDCSTHAMEFYYEGTLETEDSDDSTFRNLDWTVDAWFYVAKTETIVRSYNSTQFCGFSDWRIDEPKDVTGRTCENQYFEGGWVGRDIVAVEDERLFVGLKPSDYDGSVRPTGLNRAHPFTRVAPWGE